MKFRRNPLSRKSRDSNQNAYERIRRGDKWPAWKKNATLIKHIRLLK
jgi:hypothetical protein